MGGVAGADDGKSEAYRRPATGLSGLQSGQFTRKLPGFEQFNFYINIARMNIEAICLGFFII
jgi:hypothetical protein